MTHTHELDRDRDHDVQRSNNAADTAPGRGTRTQDMTGPTGLMPSGILMRKAARDGNGVQAGAEAAVASAGSSSGHALPTDLRGKFESSLGADLSGVRVHTGSASADAAGAVGAKAYTLGNDIHFGAGHYNPSSADGQHLLAHEVAHTVQQSGGLGRRTQFKLEVSSASDSFEVEADRAADAMVAGRPANVTTQSVAIARLQDLTDAADRGEAKVNAPLVSAITVMNVSNVEDKATANQRLNEIRSEYPALHQAIATERGTNSMVITNSRCEDLVARYIEAAEAETSQITTFQALFARFMKDFKRLDEMLTTDGLELGHFTNPATAAQNGTAQAKGIFGPDDAKEETARIKRLDPTIQTELSTLHVVKQGLSIRGTVIINSANELATTLQNLSNLQREFAAKARVIKTPEAQQALQDQIARAQYNYSGIAAQVLKDTVKGAVGGVTGGLPGIGAGAAVGAGKSAWANVVLPQIENAIKAADMQVGKFPDNSTAAEKVANDTSAWEQVRQIADRINSKAENIGTKAAILRNAFDAYENLRNDYELNMIRLGQRMDGLAKIGTGPKPKDPCTCEEPTKTAPATKEKGPRYEKVLQFLAEADRLIAQAEVVKAQGAAEHKSAMMSQKKLRDVVADPDRPNMYYAVNKREVTNTDGTTWTQLTPYPVTFKMFTGLTPGGTLAGPDETHRYGSAEGTDGYGANQAIGNVMDQIDDVKSRIVAYRESVAAVVGIG